MSKALAGWAWWAGHTQGEYGWDMEDHVRLPTGETGGATEDQPWGWRPVRWARAGMGTGGSGLDWKPSVPTGEFDFGGTRIGWSIWNQEESGWLCALGASLQWGWEEGDGSVRLA